MHQPKLTHTPRDHDKSYRCILWVSGWREDDNNVPVFTDGTGVKRGYNTGSRVLYSARDNDDDIVSTLWGAALR